jgi:hypothetical protein
MQWKNQENNRNCGWLSEIVKTFTNQLYNSSIEVVVESNTIKALNALMVVWVSVHMRCCGLPLARNWGKLVR